MGTKISVVENFLGLLLLYTMIVNCKNQFKFDDLGGLIMTEGCLGSILLLLRDMTIMRNLDQTGF